nr:RecName: Full=Uncharacterized protein SMPP14 [Nautilus macromphalus]
DFFFDFDR